MSVWSCRSCRYVFRLLSLAPAQRQSPPERGPRDAPGVGMEPKFTVDPESGYVSFASKAAFAAALLRSFCSYELKDEDTAPISEGGLPSFISSAAPGRPSIVRVWPKSCSRKLLLPAQYSCTVFSASTADCRRGGVKKYCMGGGWSLHRMYC